ncbi:MAG: hypothetical protein E3J35_02430 [Methanomassiliicoccales archaeon]|nr:MAG: hypothetical protein E3J35_02430 [Methanomassiliicoccales archaeon]
MEDSERIKEWLRFLESRLDHYSSYYNFSLSTLLIIFGLITGGVSLTFHHLWASLVAVIVVVVGAAILVRKGNVILATLSRKRNETMMLIVQVLDGSVTDSSIIAKRWMKIYKS